MTVPGQLRDSSRTTPRQLQDNSKTTPGQLQDNSRTNPGQNQDKFRTNTGQDQDNSNLNLRLMQDKARTQWVWNFLKKKWIDQHNFGFKLMWIRYKNNNDFNQFEYLPKCFKQSFMKETKIFYHLSVPIKNTFFCIFTRTVEFVSSKKGLYIISNILIKFC